MKKILFLIAVLAAFSAAASAQRYRDYGLELHRGDRVETNLRVAFPMYFAYSTLANTNNESALRTKLHQNFLYSLEMASLRFSSRRSHIEAAFGLRWTFADFSLEDPSYTFRQDKILTAFDVYNKYMLRNILAENSTYDGRKSKIHASYIGVPVRLAYKAGKGKVYVGGSAEYMLHGYTKYKHPAYREDHNDLFNRFRATAEAGFSYGLIGVFASYCFTPLLDKNNVPDAWSYANTVSFGLTIGI